MRKQNKIIIYADYSLIRTQFVTISCSGNIATEQTCLSIQIMRPVTRARTKFPKSSLKTNKGKEKQGLCDKIIKARYEWAVKHQSIIKYDWNNVVWSGTSRFEVSTDLDNILSS